MTTSAKLESSSFPLPQCGSRYVKQRAPAILAAGTAVTQWWGGRRWLQGQQNQQGWSPVSFSSPLPSYCSVEECQKDHSWRCHTQMAVKCRENFSKVDHSRQAYRTKLFTTPTVKVSANLSNSSVIWLPGRKWVFMTRPETGKVFHGTERERNLRRNTFAQESSQFVHRNVGTHAGRSLLWPEQTARVVAPHITAATTVENVQVLWWSLLLCLVCYPEIRYHTYYHHRTLSMSTLLLMGGFYRRLANQKVNAGFRKWIVGL